MQYQKEEIGDCHSNWRHFLHCADTALDGDTLVHVHMPKARGSTRKPRKARKSATKTAKPSSKRASNEPEQSNSSVRIAPVANMCIDPQTKNGKMGQKEMSEPSLHTGTSALTQEVIPDVSCGQPTIFNSHDASTMLGPPPRQDRRQNSGEENWTIRTSFGQDPAVSTNPSSSIQTSYSQIGRQQNSPAPNWPAPKRPTPPANMSNFPRG